MQCVKCLFINQTGAAFCNKCGAPLSASMPAQTSKNNALWIVAGGIFTLIVIAAILGGLIEQANKRPPTTAATSSASTASDAQPAIPEVSPATHLAEAKKALADGYKPTGENRAWGRVKDAREHLEKIQPSDKEYSQAQKLLAEVSRREAEIDKWSEVAARKVYANLLESNYLKQGMDVSVTVSGPDNTTIKLKYVLMSRPLVYQLINDEDVMGKFREFGFKKIIFTDGYFHTWTIPI